MPEIGHKEGMKKERTSCHCGFFHADDCTRDRTVIDRDIERTLAASKSIRAILGILTITVAVLATACSGVQGDRSTMGNGASFLELIETTDRQVMPDGEHHPKVMPTPQDADSDAGEKGDGIEYPKELLGDGNPQYANSDAGETGSTYEEVVGC